MKNLIFTPLFLALWLLSGCEKDGAMDDLYADSQIRPDDGFYLVSGSHVVLDRRGFDYYDFGAHLIYLKSHLNCSEVLQKGVELGVYAAGKRIYTAAIVPGYSSYMPPGPIVWTEPTFYGENILAIDLMNSFEVQTGKMADPREDPRIAGVLKKYGQFREGLEAEITSVWYGAPDELRLNLVLHNRDEVNYYYLDPEKMGMPLYHYFTNGVILWDTEEHQSYSHHVKYKEPYPSDGWDMEWMSLLEGGESVHISLDYSNFESVPPGNYRVSFEFPGLHSQVERDQLSQRHGQIWLGKLRLGSDLQVK